MPAFSAPTKWSFFETVETLFTRSGIHNHLRSRTAGSGEGVARSALKLTLVGGMRALATKHKTTESLWAAMKPRLQPETASNEYALREAIAALQPPTGGTDYDNLEHYFDLYDQAESQAVAICGSSFAISTSARLHHYRSAIPADLMRSQSILLMGITDPHKLRQTLLSATRPLVTGAATSPYTIILLL